LRLPPRYFLCDLLPWEFPGPWTLPGGLLRMFDRRLGEREGDSLVGWIFGGSGDSAGGDGWFAALAAAFAFARDN
jgi:hypothetical protein